MSKHVFHRATYAVQGQQRYAVRQHIGPDVMRSPFLLSCKVLKLPSKMRGAASVRQAPHPSKRSTPVLAVVLHQGRVVLFIHVPKCAGTSVTSLLGALGDVRFDERVRLGRHWMRPRHLTAEALEQIFVKEMFDYSFMMVRNPVDRMLSEFRYQSRKGFPRWQLYLGFDRWLAWSLNRATRHPGYRQNHFRRQVDFRAFECDVFRIEDGLAPLVQKLNAVMDAELPEEPKHLNPSPQRDMRMSRQSLDLILTTYADDFTAFGYPNDPDHYQRVLR